MSRRVGLKRMARSPSAVVEEFITLAHAKHPAQVPLWPFLAHRAFELLAADEIKIAHAKKRVVEPGLPIVLYADITVPANTTNVDIIDLDINAHKFYLILLSIKNPAASAAEYYLFVAGDYTVTNYYSQLIHGTGTLSAFRRDNDPGFAYATAGERTFAHGILFRDPDGYPRYTSHECRGTGDAVLEELKTGCKTATVTNVTSIRIASSVTNGIGADSKIQVYGYQV